MENNFIYLCSPYSHKLPEVREMRFQAACHCAAILMRRGLFVFSPIAHSHPIALAGDLPKGFDYWEHFDRWAINSCNSVAVLAIDGYIESTGITAETKYAATLGKRIQYIGPEQVGLKPNGERAE